MKFYIDLSDKRNVYLKTFLEKNGKQVFPYNEIPKHQVFFSDDVFVFSPAKKIDSELIQTLPRNITLVCGAVDPSLVPLLKEKNIKHKNLMKNESYAVKNAKLTAEGVLSLLIEKNEQSLFDNNILLLGNGRVAKACACLFQKLNLNFSMASYYKEDFAQNHFFSNKNYLGDSFVSNINDFDVIINTIPAKIINDETLSKIADNTLFIETASTPCLNKEKATHINYILAPGLPQKYCAKSAGKLMFENIIGEDE